MKRIYVEDDGTHKTLDKLHQRQVANWIREKGRRFWKNFSNGEDATFVVDGRKWHVEDADPESGGIVFRSKWRFYDYFVGYIPAEYGRYPKIKFWREKNSVFAE